MTEIELRRKELERLIIEKNFNLSDEAVLKTAAEFEDYIKKTGSV